MSISSYNNRLCIVVFLWKSFVTFSLSRRFMTKRAFVVASGIASQNRRTLFTSPHKQFLNPRNCDIGSQQSGRSEIKRIYIYYLDNLVFRFIFLTTVSGDQHKKQNKTKLKKTKNKQPISQVCHKGRRR